MENKEKLEELVPEEVIQLVNPVKKNGIIFLSMITIALIMILVFMIIPVYAGAKTTGDNIGSIAGRAAGIAVGSFDGITNGLSEGYEAGKEEGLRAKDTNVAIANEMTSIGKLDVLVAEDQFVDDFREGDDYQGLFVYKAKVTFFVNLDGIRPQIQDNMVTITLPVPECEFSIDEEESGQLAEWQKYFWSGSTEAGYIGYMNSMAQIKNKAVTEMTNYDHLMEQAKKSAKEQVKILVKSIAGNEYTVSIVFEGEEE